MANYVDPHSMRATPTAINDRTTVTTMAKTIADLIEASIVNNQPERARQYASAGWYLLRAFTTNHDDKYASDRDRQATAFTFPTEAFDTSYTVGQAIAQYPALAKQLNRAADDALNTIRQAFANCQHLYVEPSTTDVAQASKDANKPWIDDTNPQAALAEVMRDDAPPELDTMTFHKV